MILHSSIGLGIPLAMLILFLNQKKDPDVTKMFRMLDQDVSNELIVGEGIIHIYPIYPIIESIHACHKIFHTVMR